jgi:hypothetical protein
MDRIDIDRILKSMTNIKPDETQIEKIEELRTKYKDIAVFLHIYSSDSRELNIAIQNLEDSLMWAVKSILFTEYF